jgi:hypothetical protein
MSQNLKSQCSKGIKIRHYNGDQIGRIFANGVIVFVGQFLKITEVVKKNWTTVFTLKVVY